MLIPLARIYRSGEMFDFHMTHRTMSTNSMGARCLSIHVEKYFQIFGNKQLFLEAYSIKEKYDCHLGLDMFIKEYGALIKMTYNIEQGENWKKEIIPKSDEKV